MALARKLSPVNQLEVIDALKASAQRLKVHYETGLPRVEPQGEIEVRGRGGRVRRVQVERLA